MPEGHDPMADSLPDRQVVAAMLELRETCRKAALALPGHSDFLARMVGPQPGLAPGALTAE
jgi:hypothetical protein